MQDAIVARLASSLVTQLTEADGRRAERRGNPALPDLVAQGWSLTERGGSHDAFAQARRAFERALALDPDNVWALVGAANADMVVALNFRPNDRAALLASAEATVAKALSLAPNNATAHLVLGIIQIHTDRADQGVRECERALELNRNLLNAHGHIGFAKIRLGRPEETEAHIEAALALNPDDRYAYLWHLFAGLAKIYLDKDEEALSRLRRSIEANRNNPLSHFLLAAALAHLGRLSEAQSAVKAGLAINPTFTIAAMRSGSTDNRAPNAGGQRVIEGLRKAGVPEGRPIPGAVRATPGPDGR
jgi:tetratricopeptide (TPR) repeat protein